MPRPRTGTTTKPRHAAGGAFENRGKFYARVTTAPQKREAKLLAWVPPGTRHEPGGACVCVACVRARALQGMVNRLREAGEDSWIEKVLEIGAPADEAKLAELETHVAGIVAGKIVHATSADANVTTFEAFALRWVRGELAALYPDYIERKRSAAVDLGFLRKHVFPVVGPKPIQDVTLEDFERVMREIDGRAKRKLSRATRRQVAQVMRRVLVLAEYPAKIIPRNPIPTNAMPPKRTDVGLQFAYPEEDAILMRDELADLGYRILFGYLHRQGVRRAEALGGKVDMVDDAVEDDDALGDVPPLTWGRVDLRRGAILPGRNKTGDTTLTPLEPDLVRALKAWKGVLKRTGHADPVFVTTDGTPIDGRAATDAYRALLHAALVKAECDRPELWNPPHGRRELRLHDARASFVTVALVNGRSEDWVRRRSKHKSSAIERYRRELGTFREMTLGDWVPLDRAIPEIAATMPTEEPATANAAANAAAETPPTAEFLSRGEWIRTTDPQTPSRTASTTGPNIRDVAIDSEDAEGPSSPVLPRFASTCDDPVEGALADGVRAIAEAMRRAEADALPALAERMAVVVRELEARRLAREKRTPSKIIALDDRRKRSE